MNRNPVVRLISFRLRLSTSLNMVEESYGTNPVFQLISFRFRLSTSLNMEEESYGTGILWSQVISFRFRLGPINRSVR